MTKMTRTFAALLVLAGLSIGCGKKQEPAAQPEEAAAEQKQADWKPESTDQLPEGHSADDGHNH